MHQGDDEDIRRKAYEIWEKEGRPEGRHDEHWRRARETFADDRKASGAAGRMASDGTPDVSADDLHDQDKAMIPENAAQTLTQTAQPEPGSAPTPPAKRPRTQRKKSSTT